jgi:glycine cleavage system H lipoate-binding protein
MSNSIKTKTHGKNPSSHPCLWMMAGVVKKKNCSNYYDCTTCKYDTAMKKIAATGKHLSWQDAMRKHESQDRTCRHSLTSRTGPRACPMNYNCSRCDFDQIFEDSLSLATTHATGDLDDIKGFKLARGDYFHSGHTWTRIEDGGALRIGMDDFSFKVLGGPDGFDLPLIGQELKQDKAGWGIKRNSNSADIQSPVNGVITKVNHGIRKSPKIPGQDPYNEGWLFTVHNSDIKGTVKELMADEESHDWLDREVTTLEQMIEDITGPLSADGGFLRSDIYGNLPALGWNNLTRRFLGT